MTKLFSLREIFGQPQKRHQSIKLYKFITFYKRDIYIITLPYHSSDAASDVELNITYAAHLCTFKSSFKYSFPKDSLVPSPSVASLNSVPESKTRKTSRRKTGIALFLSELV